MHSLQQERFAISGPGLICLFPCSYGQRPSAVHTEPAELQLVQDALGDRLAEVLALT